MGTAATNLAGFNRIVKGDLFAVSKIFVDGTVGTIRYLGMADDEVFWTTERAEAYLFDQHCHAAAEAAVFDCSVVIIRNR